MTLTQSLIWIIEGGGAGVLASRCIEWWDWAADLPPDKKNFVAWAICAAFGLAAFFILGWLGTWVGGLDAMPSTAQEWASALFNVVVSSIMAGNATHAVTVLAKKS